MHKNEFIRELRTLAFTAFILLIALSIVFYREHFGKIIVLWFSLLYLFVIPGFFISLSFLKDNLPIEKMVIGIVVAIAASGLIIYLTASLGLHVKYNIYFVPAVIVIISLIFINRNNNSIDNKDLQSKEP